MKSITAIELRELLAGNTSLTLVDVREPGEHAAFNIGGRLIPLGDIMKHAADLPPGRPVIFYCRVGVRSAIAIQRLQERYQMENLINLQGGIEAWKQMKPPEPDNPY